ncbi:MAG TPA: sulfatase-like hydrolase/transferase [Candidatus Binatia bacterium]|jgi:hypothetical protein|nr:sulfatase-like hydrolase/transferase [Candidatus Binatia bacterium]
MPTAIRLVTMLSMLAAALLGPGEAGARIQWDRSLFGCEPPATFYSSRHLPGSPPCCPSVEGLCEGGTVCPATGRCPGTNTACVATPPPGRPNIVLMISDDQGYCQYGSARECRSPQHGIAIPAPVTPNLDLLAGHGTVFPVAHNSAPWCFPSLFSIVTGRYQRSFDGVAKPAEVFGTLPRSLRRLQGVAGAVTDPYDATNAIGGYCAFLGGKLTDRLGDPGFHAYARTGERSIGRTRCIAGAGDGPPLCGSETLPTYEPTKIFRGSDLFEFLDTLQYRVPNVQPATFAMQNFFAWYAPRIPHQPLRAPDVIRRYLFGNGPTYPLGGVFNLGAYCSGASCPTSVTAFDETVFGDVHELDGNLWWMDDSLREIRKYLAMQGAPHCVTNAGQSRFDVTTPAACNGTWASAVTPDLERNTVIMFLADNGWHLPDSKHSFTENGYRTRLIVFDPRNLPSVPSWDPQVEPVLPPNESPALAHGIDIFPTALGFALDTPGTQLCPQAPDGSRCDGRDLRPHLATAPGGPAAPETLRHALCGHNTQKVTSPTKSRYLLTRPGSVGRCTVLTAPACTTDASCGANAFCLGGHCASRIETACAGTANCAAGAVCLGGRCRTAPSCIEDADCSALLPGRTVACVAKDKKWCRNSPGTSCSTHDDCPACPAGAAACSRLCEARQLKFYVNPGGKNPEMSDLFIDPDESGLHKGDRASLSFELSQLEGPYGRAMRRASCCMDDWWPEVGALGSICGGLTCPADLTCDQ